MLFKYNLIFLVFTT